MIRTEKITNYTKIDNNYLEIEKDYDYDGKFIYEYIIYENPYNPKAVTDLPYTDN